MKINNNKQRLKTYKIKNHDSGKTYSVKAVSYTDAKMKYDKYILTKDSLTEDARSYDKYYLRRRRDKFTFSGIRGMWEEVIASYSFKKHENADAFISIIKKYVNFNMTASELLSRAPGFLMIFDGNGRQLKDSLTEDDKNDFTYKGYTVLAEYQLGSKNIVQYKIYEPDGNYLFAVKTPEQAKRAIDRVIDIEVKRQMNDADIAQNDIKSTYLPEDANADNIRYLGFNEKRKLSFYSYGDRYFVYHDLEGRTEEIDKETVQKILKKNILGEIDENDLINKEPQAEEIVSDNFDWTTTQERGDR